MGIVRSAHSARAAGLPDDGLVETLDGTMVFADVSGFTRLSERLARKGQEGAEYLGHVGPRKLRSSP